LNSNIFYVFYIVYSNCRDLNPSDISTGPTPAPPFDQSRFSGLSASLHVRQQETSRFITRNQRQTGEVRLQSFRPAEAFDLIQRIDAELGSVLSLSDEEIGAFTSFDRKYRFTGEDE
jgi:hypothetical protein